MVDDRDRALVLDIIAACREVRAYVGQLSYEAFVADTRTYRAIERCLEIIGIAARQLSAAARVRHPDVPWQMIVGLRNRLSHEYGDIDYEEIYRIATTSVPELIAALKG